MYLTTEASRGTAFAKWVVIGCLCTYLIHAFPLLALIFSGLEDQVVLGAVLGAIIGTGLAYAQVLWD